MGLKLTKEYLGPDNKEWKMGPGRKRLRHPVTSDSSFHRSYSWSTSSLLSLSRLSTRKLLWNEDVASTGWSHISFTDELMKRKRHKHAHLWRILCDPVNLSTPSHSSIKTKYKLSIIEKEKVDNLCLFLMRNGKGNRWATATILLSDPQCHAS